uniref:Uncharacterized protein n=1 Tax=Parascaris univalens TaxID=6257 RepID=A0A915A3T5_PARUN
MIFCSLTTTFQFTDWDLSALEGLPKLRHVFFEMNPCCGSDDYRFEVTKRVPKVSTQLHSIFKFKNPEVIAVIY